MTRKEAINPDDIQVSYSRSSNLKDVLIKGSLETTQQPRGTIPFGTQDAKYVTIYTNKVKLVAKPALQDRKACRNSPCMFGHPHMFGCPAYVWMPPYVWTPPHMFGCPLYVLMMFGCLLYIHNTQKACIVRLRGCPYAQYIWIPPYVWTSPHTFGCLLYVWISPICLDAPIGLDAPLYVWMPAVHIQHKESMLCWIKGVSICPPYVWMPLVCLDPPICLETPTVCLDALHTICLDDPCMF